jgi:hypothetical protein
MNGRRKRTGSSRDYSDGFIEPPPPKTFAIHVDLGAPIIIEDLD